MIQKFLRYAGMDVWRFVVVRYEVNHAYVETKSSWYLVGDSAIRSRRQLARNGVLIKKRA
jgi:hypothetical protein